LNPVGRVVLIKSVLSSLPIFQFSALHAPDRIKRELAKIYQEIPLAGRKRQREKVPHGKMGNHLCSQRKWGARNKRPRKAQPSTRRKGNLEDNYRGKRVVEESALHQIYEYKQKKVCGWNRPRENGVAYLEARQGINTSNPNPIELGSRQWEKN
jgi:hypothetical protein